MYEDVMHKLVSIMYKINEWTNKTYTVWYPHVLLTQNMADSDNWKHSSKEF